MKSFYGFKISPPSLIHVKEPTPGHFYWPDIDVDLTIEAIEHPEKFPLKAKIPRADRYARDMMKFSTWHAG